MKERTRVPKGKKYWFLAYDSIRDKGINVLPSEEECCIVDFNRCELGNYFHTKEEAEAMARKLRAVLKGAEVIEMPSEEDAEFESNKLLGLSGHDGDERTEEAYLDGFADCLHWLKSKVK